MTGLSLRPAQDCRYDAISLGEVMLRLDPGEGRIRTTRSFTAWEGGGEYNVTRGLRRAFGLRCAVVTALADNEVGHLVEDLILAGGVDTTLIRWVPYDGVGREVRNGLNFTERGFGVRGAVGVSDRGHTAASQLRSADVDWDDLFGRVGVRWFHTGGIFAALSETTAETAVAAVAAARRHGTVVSYDVNYRPSLWCAIGSPARALEVNREIAQYVDVMIGDDRALEASLGLRADVSVRPDGSPAAAEGRFAAIADRVGTDYSGFAVVATSLRTVHSASSNDWGAIAWSRGTGVVWATHRERLEILDRVGGGDSFAAGLVYGLLEGESLATALEYGAAHGALAMTTPGDSSMATREDVLRLVGGGSAVVDR